MSKIINKIQFAEEETAYVESILRQTTSVARVYVMTKILLLKDIPAEGLPIN